MAYDPGQPIQLRVEIYIPPLGWVEITSRARKASCEIRQGRSPSAIQAESSRLSMTIGNPDGYLTEGNALSPWYPYFGRGCPIRVSRLGLTVSPNERFHGKIDTLVGRYPGGNVDATVAVTAIGTLGTLGQGSEPLRSAPYRYLADLTGTVPLASWALEDGPLSTVGAALYGTHSLQPFVGTHPSGAVVTFPQWGQGTLAPWLPPVVSRSGASGLTVIWAKVAMPASPTTWTIDFAYAGGTGAGAIAVDINPSYLGGALGWPQLATDPPNQTISVSLDAGPETITTVQGLFDGGVHHVRLTASQSGGVVAWTVYIDGVARQTGTTGAFTLPQITKFALVNDASSSGLAQGYASVWGTAAPVGDYTDAIFGHRGETAADRMARLCAQEDVPFELFGTASDTAVMGPQPTDTLNANLRECELTDQGLMHDNGTEGAIGYVTRTSLYNKTAGVAVLHGSLEPDLEATWDNENIRNDVTSTGPDGGFAHVADEAHVARVGARFKEDRSPNVETDEQLLNDAGWAVHIGTAPGARYDTLGINLRNPDGALLADAVETHKIGDRITVAKSALPPQHPIDGIDGLTVGWTELLDADTWIFRPNVVPYRHEVFTVGDQTRGRLDTAGCLLYEAATASATSLKLHTYSGPVWITSAARAADFTSGFTLGAAGEQIRPTAMAAVTAPTFVGVGTASSGSSGSRTPGLPAGAASGDLVLIFASTRNSGTGTVDTPANWTSLLTFGNCRLMGRIYDGAWSMPTVTFTGGAVNEDTIAQSLALRGMCPDLSKIVISSQPVLNGSVQDIAYPTLPVRQSNCIVLLLGWKQDDYTSVATVSGATEAQEASSTAGNDASQVWDYVIQGSQADVPVGSFTVTGGAAAISRGAAIALVGGYQVATVTRAVNGVSKAQLAGEAVSLWKPVAIAL